MTLEEGAAPDAAVTALRPLADEAPELRDGVIRVPLRQRRGAIAEAVRRLDESGVGIEDIAMRRPTLDDVFIRLTGHAAEEPAGDPEERAA